MTAQRLNSASFESLSVRAAQVMEVIWLLLVFSVPLVFVTAEVMANGYVVPKVTIYRSLVGILGALWIIEFSLHPNSLRRPSFRPPLIQSREWLRQHPTRWLMAVALVILAGNLISTLLSPSISVSFWGIEPGFDGDSLYNTLSHIVLFTVLATHLKTEDQLWRLIKVLALSGFAVGLYGILQYYGLDPFGVHQGGHRILSSLGNSTHVGAFLLLIFALALATGLRPHIFSRRSASVPISVAVLSVILLALVFTQARGPWIGAAAGLTVFMIVMLISVGWRSALRGVILLSVAAVITWAVVVLGPPPGQASDSLPTGRAELATRVLSIKGELSEDPSPNLSSSGGVSVPSSLKGRLLLWESSGELVRSRGWFEIDDRPSSLSLHLFGYGPEFFRHVFELVRPQELTSQQISGIYVAAGNPHNNFVHRTVEQGILGLAGLVLMTLVLLVVALRLLLGDPNLQHRNQRLVMAALLAAVAGRIVEQLAGVPHMSDKIVQWTMLGMLVSLPAIQQRETNEIAPTPDADDQAVQTTRLKRERHLKISLAVVLAAIIVAFTLAKNPSLALAEIRATAAEESFDEGRLDEAMRQADSAISLAPGVGRYLVIRGRILDKARVAASNPSDQIRLAQESYRTNRRAVETNPFDIYSRLHFAESALTLAGMGQTAAVEVALEENRNLTLMLPRYWLSHFLLARAYLETGSPERSIKPFSEAIRLNPEFLALYEFRASAYEAMGEYDMSVKDYDEIINSSPTHSAYSQRAIALYALGQLDETLSDFNAAISELNIRIDRASNSEEVARFNAHLSLAHNNRGSVLQELGQAQNAIYDYTEAVQLNPQLGEAFYNRATAFAVLGKTVEARRDLDSAIDLGFSPTLPESPSNQQSRP